MLLLEHLQIYPDQFIATFLLHSSVANNISDNTLSALFIIFPIFYLFRYILHDLPERSKYESANQTHCKLSSICVQLCPNQLKKLYTSCKDLRICMEVRNSTVSQIELQLLSIVAILLYFHFHVHCLVSSVFYMALLFCRILLMAINILIA